MKTWEQMAAELEAVLSQAQEILSCDMSHIAVRMPDRVRSLYYTPMGGNRETTQVDYYQDMDALERVYGGGVFTLRKDGTARAYGSDVYGQCQVADRSLWETAVKYVSVGPKLLGLLPDGTVIAHGYGRYGQTSVFHWRNVVDITADSEAAAALLADGSVVGTPEWHGKPFRPSGQSAPETPREEALRRLEYSNADPKYGKKRETDWSELSELVPCKSFTLGIRRDGTFRFAGNDFFCDVCEVMQGWEDLRTIRLFNMKPLGSVYLEDTLLAGIRRDGQIYTAYRSKNRKEEVQFPAQKRYESPIVQVTGGMMEDGCPYLACLGLDGQVHLEGRPDGTVREMERWRQIRRLVPLRGMEDGWPEWKSDGGSVILGLRSDGKVEAVFHKECFLGELYRRVCREVTEWEDIVWLCGGGDPVPWAGSFVVAGLRSDGTVVVSGAHAQVPNTFGGQRIRSASVIPEERMRMEAAQWRGVRRIWFTTGHLIAQLSDDSFRMSRERSF